MKHYYLIIASHNDSEPDEIKIDITFEDMWAHLSNLAYTSGGVESFWSVIHLQQQTELNNLCNVASTTPWNSFSDRSESDINNETPLDNPHNLVDAINRLCDDVDSQDYTLVDVLWIVPSLRILPALDSAIELYGTFKWLQRWHKARITICSCEESILPLFSWARVIPLQIVKYPFAWDQILLDNVFWRGGLIHTKPISAVKSRMCGFQMRWSKRQRGFPSERFEENISVMDEVPLRALPPFMISSNKCEILLPAATGHSNCVLEKSWNFLTEANSRTDIGLVMRIGVYNGSSQAKKRDLSYENWKKHLVDNLDDNLPVDVGSDMMDFQLFVLIGDGLQTPYSASMYSLRHLLDVNYSSDHHMMLAEAYLSCSYVDAPTTQLLNSLPQLSPEVVKYLERYLVEWQRWLIENWAKESQMNIFEVAIACGAHIMKKVKEEHVGFTTRLARTSVVKNTTDDVESILLDVSNWPERQRLKALNDVKPQKTPKKKLGTMDYLSQITSAANNDLKITTSDFLSRLKSFKETQLESVLAKERLPTPVIPLRTTKNNSYKAGCNLVREKKIGAELFNRFLEKETISSGVHNSENGRTPVKRSFNKENGYKKRLKFDDVTDVKKDDLNLDNKPHPFRGTIANSQTSSKVSNNLSEQHMKKLRIAVVDALAFQGVNVEHRLFRMCAKKLFQICKTFAKDVIGRGRTSEQFQKLAVSHVKHVIRFHKEIEKPTALSK